MSQEQPRRPQADQEAVTYGDIFQVSGELASKPVAPKDAAAAQAAETIVLGQTQKGGPAAVMQSAANMNVRRGVLGPDDVTEATREHGVSISQDDVGGHRVITESVAGEVVGRYAVAGEEEPAAAPPLSALNPISMTIGQALESVALSAGDKAVDESDAAAIQAMESRATGRNQVIPGGVASEAQSAAKHNARTMAEHKKIKLRDVLAGATSKLPDDRAVTKEDADAAVGAEIRNKADMSTHPGGVAASMVAAAGLNQQQQ
ncbi:UNVERIFIED_CONTAM: Late embryogenesis abundant protein D-34 [Sesamum latifolium]|uniref:Late embryogenesis abundant protein D-34 n=1 Tax=Sesamum latifolium TaxID=2727402 RepID=A0AAW2Y1A1_9LAMI